MRVVNRKVLEDATAVCSVDGCDELADGCVTIQSPTQFFRAFGCVEHIGPLREALRQATAGRE